MMRSVLWSRPYAADEGVKHDFWTAGGSGFFGLGEVGVGTRLLRAAWLIRFRFNRGAEAAAVLTFEGFLTKRFAG